MNNLLYNALMLGRNKSVAGEEFQVAEKLKKPARFGVLEQKIDIDEVIKDTLFGTNLVLLEEGYLEIEASSKDDILVLEKRIITSQDFSNNLVKFSFTVLADKLHNGNNFAQLEFKTAYQEIKVPVIIKNTIKTHIFGQTNPKALLISLAHDYLNLRLGHISSTEWIRSGLKLLENISGNDEISLFFMLYKAQLYIAQGTKDRIVDIMEFVSGMLPKLQTPNYELSCYYLYIKSIYDMDKEGAKEALEKIRLVYTRKPTWRIAWILFFVDRNFAEDRGAKLGEIKHLFYENNFSPCIFFEAAEIFADVPEAFTRPDDFELQVLNFVLKYNYLCPAFTARLPEIINKSEDEELKDCNLPLVKKLLIKIYNKNGDEKSLRALCRILILTGDKRQENFIYFNQAITWEMVIEGLYNYYIFTMDKSRMLPVPEKITEYFVDNAETLYEYRSYFYASIIVNKAIYPDCYSKYIKKITEYINAQLSVGRIDSYSGIILKDVIENDDYPEGIKDNLLSVVCTKEIICKNPNMMSVLVFHNELSAYQDVFLENGHAFVKIFSKGAVVVFKNITGNIFYNVEYEAVSLLDSSRHLEKCISDMPISKYMFLEDMYPILKKYKDTETILQYLTAQLSTGIFRPEYERKLIKEAVFEFSETKDKDIYNELLEFARFNPDDETRGRLIDIMVFLTLYSQAFEEIKKNGTGFVSIETISKLAHIFAEMNTDNVPDESLLSLCETAFMNTSFDPAVFDYLEKFYDDEPEVLITMYRMALAHELDDDTIAERILRKSVSLREDFEGVFYVFEKYYPEGSNEELKTEYLTFRAENYLYNEDRRDNSFFKYIEMGIANEAEYKDSVYTAFLFYVIELELPEQPQIRAAEFVLRKLVRKGVMLEEFKLLEQYMELPAQLANSTVISRFSTNTEKAPEIKYIIRPSDDESFKSEKMREVLDNFYIKTFTMFCDENLTYSIDDGPEMHIQYSELNLIKDESRFSQLDNIIQLSLKGGFDEITQAAKNYFIKDKLMDRIFNTLKNE